eukprot:5481788-Pyramimonas_sp.AAC.1
MGAGRPRDRRRWNPRGVCRNGHGSAMEAAPLAPIGGAPHGTAILVSGVPTWARVRHRSSATGALGGAPYRGHDPRERCTDIWARGGQRPWLEEEGGEKEEEKEKQEEEKEEEEGRGGGGGPGGGGEEE